MFDCGEGTQRQLQRSLGLVQVDEIYLTHFHADHFLGLPGLLKTYDLTDREAPLTIYGPRGLRRALRDAAARSSAARATQLELVELEPGERRRRTTATRSEPSRSSTASAAIGYALVEDDRPGRFDPEAARAPRRSRGPDFGRAPARARPSRAPPARCAPEQVMGESAARPHRRDHRRHRALPRHRRGGRGRRAPGPRRQLRRGGGPARRRDRPLDRRPGGRAGPRGGRRSCSPWSTSPPATTSARCSRRPGGVRPSVAPRDFDVSRSRSPSAASRS